jgi:hypothetical protein
MRLPQFSICSLKNPGRYCTATRQRWAPWIGVENQVTL